MREGLKNSGFISSLSHASNQITESTSFGGGCLLFYGGFMFCQLGKPHTRYQA
jgi:hypothetical protein